MTSPTSDQAGLLRAAIIMTIMMLAGLCVLWETVLAPIRDGAWLLSLKAIPLLLALPGMVRGRIRTFQWWSMLIMIYLTEGLVRATSEVGPSQALAWTEAALATLAFALILAWCRKVRQPKLPAELPDQARAE